MNIDLDLLLQVLIKLKSSNKISFEQQIENNIMEPLDYYKLGCECLRKALEYFEKAAENGDEQAKKFLNEHSEISEIVNQNNELAKKQFIAESQELFTRGQEYYRNKDHKNAFICFKEAAEKYNNPYAMHYLSLCYSNGHGTAKNAEVAFEWLKKSADAGNGRSMFQLYICYSKGNGVTKDEKKAFEWLKKSVESGNDFGHLNLGLCYYDGKGTSRDYKAAYECFKKAIDTHNQHAAAMYRIGEMYLYGYYFAQDKEKARSWFKRSKHEGYLLPKNILDFIYKEDKPIHADKVSDLKKKIDITNVDNANKSNPDNTVIVDTVTDNNVVDDEEKDVNLIEQYNSSKDVKEKARLAKRIGHAYRFGSEGFPENEHQAKYWIGIYAKLNGIPFNSAWNEDFCN